MLPFAAILPAGPHPGRKPPLLASWLGFSAAVALAGGASVLSVCIPRTAAASVPAQWHAPLPHEGRLAELSQWWAQFDDPLLVRLVEAGQQASPTLAQATARIADARAARTARGAALLPALDANAAASRGRSDPGVPRATTSSVGVQASWELDLFGGGRAAADAAQARLESSQAGWHDARVAVAAEVAGSYLELRACEAQVRQAEADAASRAQTARITRLAMDVGFRSPAAADLADASAAQGSATLIQQQARCDGLVKALVALTAQDETVLRRELAAGTGVLPRPAGLEVAAMPAQVLAQRPDLHAAARDVAAASADAKHAEAQRWPRIALAGQIGTSGSAAGGISTNGTVWSVGPLTVTLPLFDAGVRRADAEAARIRYDAAVTVYTGRLREAVREVETALVALDGTARRSRDADLAAAGFERSFAATQASYEAGMASLFELEDARRNMVAARMAVIDLRRERVASWIALYRALGGGWSVAALEGAQQ